MQILEGIATAMSVPGAQALFQTKSLFDNGTKDYTLAPGTQKAYANHMYLVERVDRDAQGNPISVVLRNPWDGDPLAGQNLSKIIITVFPSDLAKIAHG